MDFPASMTYYVAATDSSTYTYTNSLPCNDAEASIQDYAASREYPDISTLGSANVCYRELSPACSWGFFHGVGYGISNVSDCRYHNCVTCSGLAASTTFYGDVNNVTNRYRYSLSHINAEAQASIQAAAPATCGTVVGSCGGGFGCQQTETCTVNAAGGSGSRFGYAGILQYMPLTSELVFTASWLPRGLYDFYDAAGGGASGGAAGGPRLNGVDPSTTRWDLNTGNIYPNAASYLKLSGDDYAGGTSDSDMFRWRYSAVVDCSTDFGGTPIVLTLIDSAQVLVMHYRWGMSGTPATITVTPNF